RLEEKNYIVATIHRAENTDKKEILEKILNILCDVSKINQVVFPLHPGTRKLISNYGLGKYLESLVVIEPVGYIDFMKLVLGAKGVVTDSGGIQEETSHLRIPCCTLRDNTERPVTLTLGTNKLFPIESMKSDEIINHLTKTDFNPKTIPFWDNQVSKRILDLL
ncbi:UDP-N-acetylglucosamine 2-epimerase, partial [Candidatus Kaiserbacteria bacterium]|nr:UDP-N-acetylglucosamine 2-epimerase [Candidatus Kaiserbacteria bacterium]